MSVYPTKNNSYALALDGYTVFSTVSYHIGEIIMIQSSSKIMPATRELRNVSTGVPVTDGDGVEITRVIGTPQLNVLDPFLLLT